jgi:hypothetical protein
MNSLYDFTMESILIYNRAVADVVYKVATERRWGLVMRVSVCLPRAIQFSQMQPAGCCPNLNILQEAKQTRGLRLLVQEWSLHAFPLRLFRQRCGGHSGPCLGFVPGQLPSCPAALLRQALWGWGAGLGLGQRRPSAPPASG